jgi:hypothetical protein
MKEEYAYKVVRKEDKKLLSAWVHKIGPAACNAIMEYKIDKWIGSKSGNGPLGTFKLKKEAKKFKNNFCPNGLIYKCQIQKSKWEIFWYLYFDRKYFSSSNGCDTIFARKVKLLKKVG